MIVLSDNDFEIGIYPGRCIEAKNLKRQTIKSIKWSEVKKSIILRHLTENSMNRLTYELNGYSGVIFGYEQIEEESRPIIKLSEHKLFLKSTEVEKLYSISARTLANWRHKRRGPKYHKVGGAVRYKVEDLDKFMESKKIRID